MKRVTVVLVGLLAALAFAATAFASSPDGEHRDGGGDNHGSPSAFCVAGVGTVTEGVHWKHGDDGNDERYGKIDNGRHDDGRWVYHDSNRTVTEGPCPTTAATFVPEIPNVFLCYSAFQTEPGVWPMTEAAALIKAGYWSPYAVPNTASGGTNIGGYHLVCNLATGQSAGTSVLGGAGEVYGTGATSDVTNVPGHYSVVGP